VVGGRTRALLSAATVGRLLSTGGRRIGVLAVGPTAAHVTRVAESAASGELLIHIDASYPLEGTGGALRHLGEGRVLGKVVIEVGAGTLGAAT
jgi:hypothetical protein